MSVAHKLVALSLASQSVPPPGSSNEARERRGALDELNALRRSMNVHIVRLESELEEVGAGDVQPLLTSYLRKAIVLSDLLVRAAGWPSVMPEAVPAFEQLLAEAIAWAYRWAVTELDELRLTLTDRTAPRAKSIPLDALSVFHDLSRLCSASGSTAGEQMVKTLRGIDDALYRLIKIRDRLERAIASRSG